jgi:capsid protein
MGIRNWFAKQMLTTRHGRQGGQRMYEAARRNRLLHDLIAPTTSADAELRVSLAVMRDRAHMLVRDNPYARQAKRTTQINVVGPRGIQLQGQVMKANGEEKDTRRNRVLETAWRQWCRADTCDVAGRLSFHGFEMMIAGALPESGEALIRIVRQPMGKGRVPLSLELIEAHQLDEEKSGVSDRAGIIHVFLPERIGASRGVPWLASVITTVHNLAEYEKSHWVRKRVQSNTLGWIVSKEGELIADRVENGQRLINTEPGAWNYLEPGEEPVAPNFGPDDGQYEDFSQTNYSSSRLSILEDRDHWRVVQSVIIQLFHQRVYEEWLRAAALAGDLPSPAFNDYWTKPERYNNPRWQARSYNWIDPAKELKGVEMARRLLLQSHSAQISEHSGDQFEQVVAQIAMENELKESLGLMPTLDEPAELQPEPEPDEDEETQPRPSQPVADTEAED